MSTTQLAPAALLRDLVIANRILAREGILDGFGHVSFRHPEDSGNFVIARSLGPELVTELDLQRFTLEGEQIAGNRQKAYSERAIHGGIYRARPDVQAVCHHHSPSTIPFGVTGLPLRPIFHMAGLLGKDVPVWDPQSEFGDTDMLVRTIEQGDSLARTLGPRRVTLMRGHGAIVAGKTLREVVFATVYMELNAKLQLQAMATGAPIQYLHDGEIDKIPEWAFEPSISDRAWGYWCGRAGFPDQIAR
jgi:ribulose-5-phosphate 4-epimerase/fuculose-1-phosphate aldolase